MRALKNLALSFAFLLALAANLVAQELTAAKPADVGLSAERLDRITNWLREESTKGTIPGAVAMIVRHGKIAYFESVGQLDPETKAPMVKDAIFRIYSMSKPITSVAVMMLFEQGKITLDEPIAKYIPAFKDMKVGVETRGEDAKPKLELVDAKKPITIQDLLRHSSGLTYGIFGNSMVKTAYRDAHVFDYGMDNAEFAERIAKLPLHNQPGGLWQYGHSTDILARVMEVAAGKSLFQLEKEKLLDPLGMKDTSFFVTDPEKIKRMAQPMPNDSDFRVGRINDPTTVKKLESASGGMVSSMGDYARFVQMLLNGGSFEGKTYLKPETFKMMATDYVAPGSGVERDFFYFPGDGFGFGLGLALRTDAGNTKPSPPGSVGELK